MKKYLLSGIVLFLLAGCTSADTKNTINETKERVKNTEQYLWENQVKEQQHRKENLYEKDHSPP